MLKKITMFIFKSLSFFNNLFARFLNNLLNKIILFKENIQLKNYKINGVLQIRNLGNIKIGQNFKANSGKNYNVIGGDKKLTLICAKGASLHIGNNVGISNSTIVCTDEIIIKDNVMIGGSCRIWDTDFHSLDPNIRGTLDDKHFRKSKLIVINKNVFIGGFSIILKGVNIGENSIIGAGSLVTKSIPKNQIWGGNPAKFIKNINE
jgi:acetyltransferase-like isoleucine patch superfamily enzyme